MNLREQFKTAPKLETEGIWLELGNTRIRVARAGGHNQKYNAAMERIAKQHRRAIENELLTTEKSMAILIEVYAKTIVLDWQTNVAPADEEAYWVTGIEPEEGESLLEFTEENVINVFRELPDLFLEVKATAERIQYFNQSLLDEVTKN